MDYKKILEGVVDIINTTEKSDIGFANICTYIGEKCPELKESKGEKTRKRIIALVNAHGQGMYKDDMLTWLEKQGEQPKEATYTHEVETGNGNIKALVTEKVQLPKFKVKYAGSEYNVFETKEIAGVTFYRIEDEQNHIDYVKAENCEIISVYAIKENGSPYPTKPAAFSEQKPAWSEEDQNALEDVREAIVHYWGGDTQDILLYWLKKLKQRIAP